VGAGPVGLTLAICLARLDVACMIVERRPEASSLPKMERCNARTMEIFRRLGISERVRAAGLPTSVEMDVFVMTRLIDDPILRLPYPSPDEHRRRIRETHDGTEPLEPYQLISQYVLEPLLRSVAEELEPVTVRFGCELTAFDQDDVGVTARLRDHGGDEETLEVPFLVGCDGGASTVRKALGVGLVGDGSIASLRQVQFRCDELVPRVPLVGHGRHFLFADGDPRMVGTAMVVQSDQHHFTFHTGLPEDTDFRAVIQRKIGVPLDVQILSVNPWTLHLLLAERYRDRRVLLAGDATHLVIPQGGLGMNTGVGDAVDLAWKLSGTLAGWGGSGLLDAYEIERRQIGERVIRASRFATEGTLEWRKASTEAVADESAEGRATRAEVARQANVHLRKSYEMRATELGYHYVGSPLISGAPADADGAMFDYTPLAHPGYRLPHTWLEDGSALHDHLGHGFTLLRLGSTAEDTSEMEQAIRATGTTIDVQEWSDSEPRAVYGHDLLLVRPDLHVAWCDSRAPTNPTELAAAVTGH
jgi:2-polyprenyl-6-methoxyphenol hydroxylase-like FAD-dependent oxidoreductase